MVDAIDVYDVRTDAPAGERRLRAVAKICEGIGIRVQKSVFELRCTSAQLVTFMKVVEDTIEPDDSIRVYHVPAGVLGSATQLGRTGVPPCPGALIL